MKGGEGREKKDEIRGRRWEERGEGIGQVSKGVRESNSNPKFV